MATYDYASFTIEDAFISFTYSDDGPSGTEPHGGDPDGAIDSILERYPAEDVEVQND